MIWSLLRMGCRRAIERSLDFRNRYRRHQAPYRQCQLSDVSTNTSIPAQMTDQTSPTLLVTVGSTLFPALTDAVLSGPILEILSDRISTLRIQLGRANVPAHLQATLSDYQPGEDGCRGRLGKMEVDIMRYTDNFEGLVKGSDMVISHAGMSVLTSTTNGRIRLNSDHIESWETINGGTQYRSDG